MARGGYPMGAMGGMNMNNLMKQAQKMQQQMQDAQKELETKTYTATAGGAVTATVSGKKQLTEIKIDPAAIDPEEADMLQDMIVAAVNQALEEADKDSQSAYGKITGGMGGFGL